MIETTTTFAEAVTGTPRIPFTLGAARKHANFHGGSRGTAPTFRYTASDNVLFKSPALAA